MQSIRSQSHLRQHGWTQRALWSIREAKQRHTPVRSHLSVESKVNVDTEIERERQIHQRWFHRCVCRNRDGSRKGHGCRYIWNLLILVSRDADILRSIPCSMPSCDLRSWLTAGKSEDSTNGNSHLLPPSLCKHIPSAHNETWTNAGPADAARWLDMQWY